MKILFFDIETTPYLGWAWRKYDQDLLAFAEQSYTLCFAYKFAGDKKTQVLGLPDFKLYKKDPTNDRALVQKLWELFDEADIIVAHYGDGFDVKRMNARFLYHGFTPPSPYKTVDTKKIAAKHFDFPSNKLDDIGKYLGLGEKEDTGGIKLWFDCMAGVNSAWKKMLSYNKQDVTLLEKVYQYMLPWMSNHPNTTDGDEVCPKCGSHHLQSRGTAKTLTAVYRRMQCMGCGGWCRSRKKVESNDTKIVNV